MPDSVPPPYGQDETNWFAKAIAFGLVGAVVAAVAYAFLLTLPFRLSLFVIGVAYIVAKAMMIGSGERGGRKYQIVAIVLTCLSVGLANTFLVWWMVHQQEGAALSIVNLISALPYGFGLAFNIGRSGTSGIFGLLILFIGLRAAWRMTSGAPGASQHPFSR